MANTASTSAVTNSAYVQIVDAKWPKSAKPGLRTAPWLVGICGACHVSFVTGARAQIKLDISKWLKTLGLVRLIYIGRVTLGQRRLIGDFACSLASC